MKREDAQGHCFKKMEADIGTMHLQAKESKVAGSRWKESSSESPGGMVNVNTLIAGV
jgi:hypothetical protein